MDLEKGTFISSISPYPEEEYYLGKSSWSGSAADWDQRFEVGDVIADPSGSWEPGTAEAYIDQQVATVTGNLASETLARQTADQSLQTQINAEATTRANVDNTKADKATTLAGYGITNAYTKTEVNDLVDTPHQNYVTVQTYSALPASGSDDTIYRISNYDGSIPEVNVTKYSEYAWSTSQSQYIFLCVKSQIDEVFDITVYHSNTTYSDLAAALGTDGANIPPTLRRGGMSIKYVQSSDNKYVQFRSTSRIFSLAETDWEEETQIFFNGFTNKTGSSSVSDLDITDDDNNILVRFTDGHIQTKNFNSSEYDSAIYPITKDNIFTEDELGNPLPDVDLDIVDENNHILARFQNGTILTKNNLGGNYLPRPNNQYGKVCFTTEINTNIPDRTTDEHIGDNYVVGTDHGCLFLPTNYTQAGEPTRLIISCHGASSPLSYYTDVNIDIFDSSSHWVKLGFAVLDVYGLPDGDPHFGNPCILQCYKKGYDYVMERYNLRKDGVFVFGVSMGGISSFQIVQSNMFPVLAHIGICPCIDLFKQAYCNPWTAGESIASFRELFAQYFGFTGTEPTWTTSKPASSEEIQYFKDNIDKVVGYVPIYKNVINGNFKNTLNVVPTPIGVNNYPAEEKAVYDELSSIHPCPLLLIHAMDDATVAYRYTRYLYDMLRRTGQTVDLRTFTHGQDGYGHNSWDCGDEITIQDIDGNNLTLRASKYESYLFFKRYN